jgi:hypothetical protein
LTLHAVCRWQPFVEHPARWAANVGLRHVSLSVCAYGPTLVVENKTFVTESRRCFGRQDRNRHRLRLAGDTLRDRCASLAREVNVASGAGRTTARASCSWRAHVGRREEPDVLTNDLDG